MTTETSSPVSNEAGSVTGEKKMSRSRLLPAIFLAIAWLCILAVLSLWTANPVMVNRTQILQSHFILTGRITDPATGAVEVLEIKRVDTKPIDPTWLNKTIHLKPIRKNWEENTERLFPIFRNSNGNWEITPAPIPGNNHIDYPATESIKEEIAAILISG